LTQQCARIADNLLFGAYHPSPGTSETQKGFIMGRGKRLEMDCDSAVADSLVPHFEAIEVAKRTVEAQELIISKILSAHFEGFRTKEYEYNPNRRKFERAEGEE